MSVQTTNTSRPRAEVPRLGLNVTIGKNSKDRKDGCQVDVHVETFRRGVENLSEGDVTITRQIAIVGEQVESRARTSGVGRGRSLECVSCLRTQVIRTHA